MRPATKLLITFHASGLKRLRVPSARVFVLGTCLALSGCYQVPSGLDPANWAKKAQGGISAIGGPESKADTTAGKPATPTAPGTPVRQMAMAEAKTPTAIKAVPDPPSAITPAATTPIHTKPALKKTAQTNHAPATPDMAPPPANADSRFVTREALPATPQAAPKHMDRLARTEMTMETPRTIPIVAAKAIGDGAEAVGGGSAAGAIGGGSAAEAKTARSPRVPHAPRAPQAPRANGMRTGPALDTLSEPPLPSLQPPPAIRTQPIRPQLARQQSAEPPFAVHITSYKNRANVGKDWKRLVGEHPEQLLGLRVRISTIDLGPPRGRFYRLKAGPLPTRQFANALCRSLRQKGLYCAVMRFTGQPPN